MTTIQSTFNGHRFRIEPGRRTTRDNDKTVVIHAWFNSPWAYVTFAAELAHQYRFRIDTPVTYHRSGSHGGSFTFDITCDEKTSRNIYKYGSSAKRTKHPSTNDILEDYRNRFGTDDALDPEFVKKYWVYDEFNGNKYEFDSFAEARDVARTLYGHNVAIHTNKPFSTFSEIAGAVPGAGVLP